MSGRQLTEDDLRAGLKAVAEWGRPASVPPLPDVDRAGAGAGAAGGAVVPLAGRRGLRGAAPWWAAVAAVLAMVLAATVLLRPGPAPSPVASGMWAPMAEAPIGARAEPASVWTGTEVVVVGGEAATGPFLSDAAAYNPRTNSWRRLPDAPVAIPFGAQAVWTGREVVIAGNRGTRLVRTSLGMRGLTFPDPVALNPATGVWRSLPRPPAGAVEAIGAADGAVFVLAPDRQQPVLYRLGDDGRSWVEIARRPAAEVDASRVNDWVAVSLDESVVFAPLRWVTLDGGVGTSIGYVVNSGGGVDPLPAPTLAAKRAEGAVLAQATGLYSALGPYGVLFTALTHDTEGGTKQVNSVLDVRSRRWRQVAPLKRYPFVADLFLGMTLTSVGDSAVLLGGVQSEGIESGSDAGGLALAVDADADRWHRLPKPVIDMERAGHTAVWTGAELVVWGGLVQRNGPSNRVDTPIETGAVYRPALPR